VKRAVLALCGLALVACASAQLFPGYALDNAECVVQPPTHAAREACVSLVQAAYCGDGGIATWGDSGFCGVTIPDTGAAAFIAAEGGVK
jgi:hypothetical protein